MHMSMYRCICIGLYIPVHTHVHVCMHVHKYVHTCLYTYVHVDVSVQLFNMYIYIYVYTVHTCVSPPCLHTRLFCLCLSMLCLPPLPPPLPQTCNANFYVQPKATHAHTNSTIRLPAALLAGLRALELRLGPQP